MFPAFVNGLDSRSLTGGPSLLLQMVAAVVERRVTFLSIRLSRGVPGTLDTRRSIRSIRAIDTCGRRAYGLRTIKTAVGNSDLHLGGGLWLTPQPAV
jgi:hypothetical protein